MNMKYLKGIPVSNGIIFGKAAVYHKNKHDVIQHLSQQTSVETALENFERIKEQAYYELDELIHKSKEQLGEENAAIFFVQQQLLGDPLLQSEIYKGLTNGYSLEETIRETTKSFAQQIHSLLDEHFKERAIDITDLGNRLLRLLNKSNHAYLHIEENRILVVDEIAPSDLLQVREKNILALVLRNGGRTSHTTYIARSLGLPSVIGLGEEINSIKDGDYLIVDGDSGTVIINPDESVIEVHQKMVNDSYKETETLNKYCTKKAITIDEFEINIHANVSNLDEAEAGKKCSEGIGLLRTELLFMNHTYYPTENEQFEMYKEITEKMNGKPTVLRIFDIGGDKRVSFLPLADEPNPYLGFRGIRVMLEKEDFLITQLKAILRAGIYGEFKVLVPMLTNVFEIKQFKKLLEKAKAELRREQKRYVEQLKIGIMIEVPSAVLIADELAKHVDFFSIGTNDLTQYTLAVDRNNDKVAQLYNCLNPAVLKLMKMTLDVAKENQIEISICGEMASNLNALPILIGLGVQNISVDAHSLCKHKKAISKSTYQSCKNLTNEVLSSYSLEETLKILEAFMNKDKVIL